MRSHRSGCVSDKRERERGREITKHPEKEGSVLAGVPGDETAEQSALKVKGK